MVAQTQSNAEEYAQRGRPFGLWVQTEKRWYVIIAIVVFILMLIVVDYLMLCRNGFWSILSNMSNFIQIVTLAVACVIWYMEAREEWVKQLPKRMTVLFFAPYKNDIPIFCCQRVPLMNEGDLRAWGQQVGCQMASTAARRNNPTAFVDRLEYHVNLLVKPPGPETCDDIGTFYHYKIVFQLTKLPQLKGGSPYQTSKRENKEKSENLDEKAQTTSLTLTWEDNSKPLVNWSHENNFTED